MANSEDLHQTGSPLLAYASMSENLGVQNFRTFTVAF